MKAILALPLFLAAGLMADEAVDRAAIDRAVSALNDPVQRPGVLARDVETEVDFDWLIGLHEVCCRYPGVTIGMNEPWRELTVPRIVSGRIRFVTPNVAIVDGASTIRGAVTLAESVPLLFVLRREGAEWRVALVRRLATSKMGAVAGE
jgi:hypothetical protein